LFPCGYSLIALWDTSYEAKPYHIFLIFLAFTLGATALNIFGVRLLPHVDKTAFIWSLTGLVTVMITLLATARGEYQPGSFVFGNFTNRTGWPDGWAFIIGLLQSTFGLTGFDAVCHLSDEMVRPSINGPRVMVGAVLIGASTSWVFLVVLLFTLKDFDQVISSSAGSLIEVYFQATSSRVGVRPFILHPGERSND
jgi:choline transport protein